MAAQKGYEKIGGRQPGTENKVTKDIKEAFRQLIDNNLDNMSIWLAKVAEKNSEKALMLMINLSEYIVPKLLRTEIKDTPPQDYLPQFIIMKDGEEISLKIKGGPPEESVNSDTD